MRLGAVAALVPLLGMTAVAARVVGQQAETRPPLLLGAPGGIIPVSADAYQATESKLGRKLAAIRMYARWDTPFPDATSLWAADAGRRVLLSVKAGTRSGQTILYRDIAAAVPGSPTYAAILRWADGLKSFPGPISFTFNHEPEGAGSAGSGTAAEYVAAWQRMVQVFRDRGVRNVTYLFIGTGNGFRPGIAHSAVPYYPGDDWVDAIGADAYNWAACRVGITNKWRSLADLIEPLRVFGLAHPSKPLWLPEFASVEDPALPDRKADWVREVQALFSQPAYASFAGILVWYSAHPVGSCGFRVDSSPAALAAYRALAADATYSGWDAAPAAVPALGG